VIKKQKQKNFFQAFLTKNTRKDILFDEAEGLNIAFLSVLHQLKIHSFFLAKLSKRRVFQIQL